LILELETGLSISFPLMVEIVGETYTSFGITDIELLGNFCDTLVCPLALFESQDGTYKQDEQLQEATWWEHTDRYSQMNSSVSSHPQ